MKITRIFLVFLILASLLLAGCTDRKPKTSNPSADLPEPTITSGTPETSQPNTQESPAPETVSLPPESSAAATSAPTDLPEASQSNTQVPPAPDTDPMTPETSAADSSEPAAPSAETEQNPTAASAPTVPPDSSEEPGGQAATIENTSGADPVEAESTDDPGGIQVEEDPTIYASGDVELIGGD